jgi:hypothetical protein
LKMAKKRFWVPAELYAVLGQLATRKMLTVDEYAKNLLEDEMNKQREK